MKRVVVFGARGNIGPFITPGLSPPGQTERECVMEDMVTIKAGNATQDPAWTLLQRKLISVMEVAAALTRPART